MNSRRPTKAEQIYIDGAIRACGCVSCEILGNPNDYLPEQLSIHHSTDKGSKNKLAHFFSVPLCPVCHQGVVPPGMKLPPDLPVRHSPLGSHEKVFKEKVGSDLELVRFVWSKLSLDAIDAIGEITGIYSFDELLKIDSGQI